MFHINNSDTLAKANYISNIFITIRYQYKRIHFLEGHTVLLIAAAIKIG